MNTAAKFSGIARVAVGAIFLSCAAVGAVDDPPAKVASDPANKKVRQADLIGKVAPALSIEKFLQASDGAAPSWSSLKGKCVVLEFWATWCAPCVASIPHLNDLRNHFKDRPIEFIAVTEQSEEKIVPFLKRRPIEGWIGLDTNGSLFRDYAVRGIPLTVLVDGKGVTIAMADPDAVTVRVLESLLAGQPLNLPAFREVEDDRIDSNEKEALDALFQILIRPSKVKMGSGGHGGGRFSMTGCKPGFLFSNIYDFPRFQIDVKADLPKGTFDVIASAPNDQEEQLYQLLRRAVELTFRIKTRRETRETDVYVLEKIKDSPAKLASSIMGEGGTSTKFSPKRIELINEPLATLTRGLGSQIKKPVIDETGLEGRYDIRLEGKLNEPDSLIRAIRESLGLELRPAKRPVEFLVIENDSVSKDQ
ncbi:MAG TPA: TIGR03435 family protein [Phycisphaerae bacterium]|nr:TIGR03435 family protein [Phycisphaerae bacterium]